MKTTELDKLPRLVFFSEEDGEYVATVPGMPLISALAETEAEALAELQVVLETCAEVAKEKGMPFPPLDVEPVKSAAPVLNLSELARRMGITQSTLASKLQRGTPLKPEESEAIHSALRESGLALIGTP